ncbi:hypothetical protein HDU91_005971, partial [Kappamyces sp. JEL0680]
MESPPADNTDSDTPTAGTAAPAEDSPDEHQLPSDADVQALSADEAELDAGADSEEEPEPERETTDELILQELEAIKDVPLDGEADDPVDVSVEDLIGNFNTEASMASLVPLEDEDEQAALDHMKTWHTLLNTSALKMSTDVSLQEEAVIEEADEGSTDTQ